MSIFDLLKRSAPLVEFRDSVSIRMEAIGGQGANSAGKILAEAAVIHAGFTGNHFSSFGSEKRGTPIKSYVRFSTKKRPVRSASEIEVPNLLIIFHEILIQSHPEILSGCNQGTDLLISTSKKLKDLKLPSNLALRRIATLDAHRLAREAGGGVNAVLLGAASRLLPEIPAESIAKTLADFFQHRGESVVLANQKAFLKGTENLKISDFKPSTQNLELPKQYAPPSSQERAQLGWANAPIGGMIINPGNSVLKNLGASRKGVAPLLNRDLCFHCGFCDMVCPDYCFVWERPSNSIEAPKLKGIDYQYCKGCQKCVAVCPVEALTPTLESEIPEKEHQFKLFPNSKGHYPLERPAETDWIAYIDRLNEEQKMMTIETELLDPSSYLKPDFSSSPIVTQRRK